MQIIRRRNLRVMLLVLLFSVPSVCLVDSLNAQAQARFQFAPRWQAGDTFVLHIDHEREDHGPDGSRQAQVRSRVKVIVERFGVEGGELLWTVARSRVDGAMQGALASRLARMNEGLALRIKIDAQGHPAALANLQEVCGFFEKNSEAVKAAVDELKVPDDAAAKILQDFKLLHDPQRAEAAALSEIRLWLRPLAWRLPEDGEEEFDAWVEPPLPEVDRVLATGTQSLHWPAGRQKAGAVQMRMTLEGQLPVVSKGSLTRKYRFEEVFSADVDATTGWPARVVAERRLEEGERRQIDVWTFQKKSK